GSMEPTIPYGSVSVVRELEDPRTLQPGDIIQYISPSNGFVTTHRIIALAPDGASFETRGDANNVADSDPVPFRNIQGRYEFHVPYVGEAMQWLRSPWGYAVMVVVPGVLLILLEVRRMFRALRAARAANR